MSILYKQKPVGAKRRGWLRIDSRRLPGTDRTWELSQEENPHLSPIADSIAQLDARYPWLAVANRENWNKLKDKPTITILEFKRLQAELLRKRQERTSGRITVPNARINASAFTRLMAALARWAGTQHYSGAECL